MRNSPHRSDPDSSGDVRDVFESYIVDTIETLRAHAELARRLVKDLGNKASIEQLTRYATSCDFRAERLEALSLSKGGEKRLRTARKR